MKKIEKILVPIDFSDCSIHAFRYALIFADFFEAEITLQNVCTQEVVLEYPVLVAPETALINSIRKRMEKLLETELPNAQPYPKGKMKYAPKVLTCISIGPPAATILRKAAEENFDLILLGTKGATNALDKLFGGITNMIVQEAKCPVLVVPEFASLDSIKHLCYATDLTVADPFFIWETGTMLRPLNALLTVCHIHPKKEKKHALNLNDLEEFFANKSPALQVRFKEDRADDVAEGLLDYAFVYDVDVIILYAPKRSFLEDLFHRSTSRKMVLESEVPLFIIR